MFEKLPETLKKEAGFLLWKYEKRDGNQTKVPYKINGFRADATNRSNFSAFEAVKPVFDKGGYDGIGIFVEPRFSAIDIDDCVTDDGLTDLAKDIIGQMDSYTEYSPSGKGIRIIIDTTGAVLDKAKYYVNNRKLHVEAYTEKKYVSTTGNAILEKPVRKCADDFIVFLNKYMVKPENKQPKVIPPGSFLSAEEVIEKASSAANGEKFVRLYNGDITGYASHSEADYALIGILAFWCGGDEDQMDDIFRSSALMRDKWERTDYRETAIRKAVESVSDFYVPYDICSAADDFDALPDAASPFPDEPIPLKGVSVPLIPLDALPKCIADYVLAVSESTQTPADIAAVAALSVLSIGMQGKYVIRPKPDWTEPVNTFIGVFMPPSERKSAVCSAMAKPMNEYEKEWNKIHASEFDFSKSRKSILERKLKTLEDQVSKGKVEMADVRKASEELTEFREVKPMRLYGDDVTTEKLVSMISENNGKAAIFSPEGGIFDLLKGMYTIYVNIDVFLKGYSGDPIRVDRIGRESETIYDPVLTIMLMAQPSVLAGVMENGNFRGRGLTARFLYCVPESNVGKRKYRSQPIPPETYAAYADCINNILSDEPEDAPVVITLSPEADALLEAFSEELEPKLKTNYADIADWAGKIVGSTARIAALLCRAERRICREFLTVPEPLIVSGETMANAVRIGRYFIKHAKAAFSLLGADESIRNCKYVLSAIAKAGLTECSRRDIMRLCRALKTKDAVQPVIDQLVEYGYLAEKQTEKAAGRGRTQSGVYLVNPCVYSEK